MKNFCLHFKNGELKPNIFLRLRYFMFLRACINRNWLSNPCLPLASSGKIDCMTSAGDRPKELKPFPCHAAWVKAIDLLKKIARNCFQKIKVKLCVHNVFETKRRTRTLWEVLTHKPTAWLRKPVFISTPKPRHSRKINKKFRWRSGKQTTRYFLNFIYPASFAGCKGLPKARTNEW